MNIVEILCVFGIFKLPVALPAVTSLTIWVQRSVCDPSIAIWLIIKPLFVLIQQNESDV